jgi:DNA-binding MarR family transcriptional regulator
VTTSDGDVAEPRWLSAPQQRAWRAYIEAVRLLQESLDAQLQADAQMPHAYYEILVRLSEAPRRRLRMAQLADGTQSSRSRLSHAIARLEERGWVHREPCATDRRGQVAVLTDEGYAALAAAAPGHVAQVRVAVIDALTGEQLAALADASLAIAAAIRSGGSCAEAG